jgi:hypothetical protein
MKVLLDECMDHRHRHELPGHDVKTVEQMGWASITNGKLLRLAADAGFGTFITVDQGISYQNDVASIAIAVFILKAKNNSRVSLKPLFPQLLAVIDATMPGTVTIIGS